MDVDLNGVWCGWRLRGQYLISDDGQRMTQERLRGPLWRDELELRRAGYVSRRNAEKANRAAQYSPKVKVVVISLDEYRLHGVEAS